MSGYIDEGIPVPQAPAPTSVCDADLEETRIRGRPQ